MDHAKTLIDHEYVEIQSPTTIQSPTGYGSAGAPQTSYGDALQLPQRQPSFGNLKTVHEEKEHTSASTTQSSIEKISSFIKEEIESNTKWSRKNPNKIYLLSYNFIAPFFVIASAASLAWYLDLPGIFPSLGPTAFLHFAIPNKPPSSPRNTLIGHALGILAGWMALEATGLYYNPNAFDEQVSMRRIWCAALSVGVTCFLMVLFKCGHPPAGATTLIVSLGLLKTYLELGVMMAAVIVITAEAFIINRIFRLDVEYPLWAVPKDPPKLTEDQKRQEKANKSLMGYFGYSAMRLSHMNIKFKKLKTMK
eukprot:148206_1